MRIEILFDIQGMVMTTSITRSEHYTRLIIITNVESFSLLLVVLERINTGCKFAGVNAFTHTTYIVK
jgi:hypothetical protein